MRANGATNRAKQQSNALFTMNSYYAYSDCCVDIYLRTVHSESAPLFVPVLYLSSEIISLLFETTVIRQLSCPPLRRMTYTPRADTANPEQISAEIDR
jgi:hypothetical protein